MKNKLKSVEFPTPLSIISPSIDCPFHIIQCISEKINNSQGFSEHNSPFPLWSIHEVGVEK